MVGWVDTFNLYSQPVWLRMCGKAYIVLWWVDTWGAAKTLEKVRVQIYWSGQRNEVDMWCRKCAICNSRKAPPERARAPLEICLAQRPLRRVAMDILGPLPETPLHPGDW